MKFSQLFFSFLMSFVITNQAFGVIIERQSMRDVAPLIDTQTLVVFDIDNTLIHPIQTLGSDQWFRFVLKSYTDKGVPQDQALVKALAYWKKVNEVSHVIPVENQTPQFIRRMQEAGVKIIVLTARPTDTVDLTDRQFRESRLDFDRSTIAPNSDVTLSPGLRYHHGVLFSSGQDKGASLVTFLNYYHLNPPKIVFVDDLLKNVTAVDAALTQAHLNGINVRYSALDEQVKAYNNKIPLVEWGIFSKYGRLISDAQALQIINNPQRVAQ